jgi:hypothetical protein
VEPPHPSTSHDCLQAQPPAEHRLELRCQSQGHLSRSLQIQIQIQKRPDEVHRRPPPESVAALTSRPKWIHRDCLTTFREITLLLRSKQPSPRIASLKIPSHPPNELRDFITRRRFSSSTMTAREASPTKPFRLRRDHGVRATAPVGRGQGPNHRLAPPHQAITASLSS